MAAAARSSWSWAELNSELVVSIAAMVAADGSPLRDYESLRCVCAAWRSALATPYPCLLSLAYGGGRSASVFSLPMRRSLRLYTSCEALEDSLRRIHGSRSKHSRYRVRVIGSANGCLAVAVDDDLKYGRGGIITCFGSRPVRILLLDPRRGSVVLELPHPNEFVRKVVFTNDAGHGTVVAACDSSNVVYVGIGSGWGRAMEWTVVDNIDGDALADLAFDAGGERLYCLGSGGAVRVLRIPRNGQNSQEAPAVVSVPPLTRLSAVFPAPYDAASRRSIIKHLFFCHGSLYQIWKKAAAAVKLGCGLTTVPADEIFVLRYDPKQWPAWEAVKDLGGRSVFVGQNSSPVVVRAAGVGAMPRVRADCVYWISCLGIPMVCDVATGTSEPCVTPCSGVCRGDCWYFGDENMTSIDRGGGDQTSTPIRTHI